MLFGSTIRIKILDSAASGAMREQINTLGKWTVQGQLLSDN
jgi:hypothetical protein